MILLLETPETGDSQKAVSAFVQLGNCAEAHVRSPKKRQNTPFANIIENLLMCTDVLE
jgi:hypothetical protein